MECEVKWTLGSITMNKVSGGDGIPPELFQILKDDAVKLLDSICQQIWKTHQWPQDWKRTVFIPIPKKGNAKECSNCHTIALISHTSKKKVKVAYHVRLFATPWTIEFSRPEYWSEYLFPSPGDLPNPRLLRCRWILYHQSYQGSPTHASRVMFKILKLGFNVTWTENLQMFKLDLEKGEEPEIKLLTSIGS